MLTLAFDTATDVATSALLDGDMVLGERVSVARTVLSDVDRLLRDAGVPPADLARVVVGLGPGSFTGTRMGIAAARAMSSALQIPLAGVSTLDALAEAANGAFPVIDARRGEVFVPGPRALAPDEIAAPPGATLVGSGALRYRERFVALGFDVPVDHDPRHIPWARAHARLAVFGGAAVEPIYVRAPDADKVLARP
ncbi:MAG: tRNA (adenosine(37)-N6)-threonylcarbamoyltransferase complex dimerization subunit type 1 TsaB [Gaiella sp.]